MPVQSVSAPWLVYTLAACTAGTHMSIRSVSAQAQGGRVTARVCSAVSTAGLLSHTPLRCSPASAPLDTAASLPAGPSAARERRVFINALLISALGAQRPPEFRTQVAAGPQARRVGGSQSARERERAGAWGGTTALENVWRTASRPLTIRTGELQPRRGKRTRVRHCALLVLPPSRGWCGHDCRTRHPNTPNPNRPGIPGEGDRALFFAVRAQLTPSLLVVRVVRTAVLSCCCKSQHSSIRGGSAPCPGG